MVWPVCFIQSCKSFIISPIFPFCWGPFIICLTWLQLRINCCIKRPHWKNMIWPVCFIQSCKCFIISPIFSSLSAISVCRSLIWLSFSFLSCSAFFTVSSRFSMSFFNVPHSFSSLILSSSRSSVFPVKMNENGSFNFKDKILVCFWLVISVYRALEVCDPVYQNGFTDAHRV